MFFGFSESKSYTHPENFASGSEGLHVPASYKNQGCLLACTEQKRIVCTAAASMGVRKFFSMERPIVDFPGVARKIVAGRGQRWRNFILPS